VARGARVRATPSFVCDVNGEQVIVHQGEPFPDTHAVVKKLRELFEAEQAAAPGEVRSKTRVGPGDSRSALALSPLANRRGVSGAGTRRPAPAALRPWTTS
jgi:hypothetical protein